MFKKTISRKEKLTVNLAESYLKMNTFAEQRKLNDIWVKELSEIVKQDLFTSGHIAIALYKNGSGTIEKYLVNGQHQCHSVISANKSIDVMYEEYDCGEDLESVSELYRQFDNHKARSLRNLVGMEKMALGLNWPVKIAQLIVSGAALKEGLRCAHKNIKVQLLKKYEQHGAFINSILSDSEGSSQLYKQTKHMSRGAVIHAMMLTWEKCHSDSESFWEDIRDGEMQKRNQPQKVLRDYLMSISANQGRGAEYYRINIKSNHEITSKCITAWNAYRQGTTTQLKYYSDKKIPKAI